jgi:WD40 repeat protein/tRNA A-37 threonylcarbamoyl transferase component Bud32
VKRLLDAHEKAGELLDKGAADLPTLMHSLNDEGPCTVIGRYKLLEKIGEGGFGVVYVAEQREPVKRRVALKIIKLGMDTKQVVARFEAERQALALMDHPNIAKVLDAGATETGRPYFVMELVKGIPITKYSDQEKLSTNDRLDLFIKVCHAIQHAHQKGIIHRDIKPSNILVTLHDGVAVPKVIDFGIAKATQGELTDKTVYTQFQQFIGTPAYMSPEQAEMSGLDIDTRSDIYALGVLLYEMLTGSTPFDTKELVQSGLDEMRKIIREREPVRPSTRLTQQLLTQRDPNSAKSQIANRKSQIPSDLDWIVMKCLEKDRSRRYETASGLATDLKRHLDNEPVIARPPSAAYRFQKAFRRNKLAFGAAACVIVALLLGIVASSWQAIRANRERQKAVTAQEVAKQQSRVAEQARQKAEAESYASDINTIESDLAAKNVAHARELLARHYPQPGQRDLRGWEWRYLWQQCRSDAEPREFSHTKNQGAEAVVSVSSDGKWLAIGEGLGSVLSILNISNALSPQSVATLPIGKFSFMLAWSPKEPLLAYSDDGILDTDVHQLHLWNARSRTNNRVFRLSNVCVGLAFSGDGKKLVTLTGGYPGTISELTVWSVQDGRQISAYPADTDPGWLAVNRLALTPDFTGAAWCTRYNQFHLIDLATGTNRWTGNTIRTNAAFATVVISSDGKLLVSVEDHLHPLLRFWDVETGQELGVPIESPEDSVTGLAFLDQGRTLLSAAAEVIRLWDITDPSKVRPKGRPLIGPTGVVRSIAVLPGANMLLSGARNGAVYAWNLQKALDNAEPATIKDTYCWEFGSDGQSIVALFNDRHVSQLQGPNFDVSTPLFELAPDEKIRGAIFSRFGRLLVALTTNSAVRVWNVKERRVVRELGPFPDSNISIQWGSTKGRKLIVAQANNQSMEEWDLDTLQKARIQTGSFDNLHYSDDGKLQLRATFDGSFSLTDLVTGRETSRNLGMPQVIDGCAFAPNNRLFAASSYLGYASVWEADTFRLVATFGSRHRPFWICGFSPDGTRLLTSGYGSRAHQLWDLETQRELVGFPGEFGAVFSPDGNLLVCKETGQWKIYRAPALSEIDSSESAERVAR